MTYAGKVLQLMDDAQNVLDDLEQKSIRRADLCDGGFRVEAHIDLGLVLAVFSNFRCTLATIADFSSFFKLLYFF